MTFRKVLSKGVKHTITWMLPDRTTAAQPLTAEEYVDLGRAAPVYPATPDARAWEFHHAAGGQIDIDTPSGWMEPGTVCDAVEHAEILIMDEMSRIHVLPRTIYRVVHGVNGPTILPTPVLFTLVNGTFTKKT